MSKEPLRLLKSLVAELEKWEHRFCLTGGLAASIYRASPRLTQDVDIALLAKPLNQTKSAAEKILSNLGYEAAVGFIDASRIPQQRRAIMLIGRADDNHFASEIDILLPALPWVEKAVNRAQENKIDFGFAAIPTICPEDLILAKIYALMAEPDRFQDMDDLKSIFQSKIQLDSPYLLREFEESRLSLPKQLFPHLPKFLLRAAKNVTAPGASPRMPG